MANLDAPPGTKLAAAEVSPAMRVASLILRALFLVILGVVAIRVSLPQSETIWTAYETPADLVRLTLGLALCAWLIYQLLHGPADASGYRSWFYLGLVAVPFALICAYAVW